MPAPFGRHTTLEMYLAWAEQRAGCKTHYRYVKAEDGKPYCVVTIYSGDGKRWVVEVGTLPTDYLAPTTIARFDRRLGVTSPFFSLPDDGTPSGDPNS